MIGRPVASQFGSPRGVYSRRFDGLFDPVRRRLLELPEAIISGKEIEDILDRMILRSAATGVSSRYSGV